MGIVGYVGGLIYNYNIYLMMVDFGNGFFILLISVNVVILLLLGILGNFLLRFGVVGVLGIGFNNGFLGISFIVIVMFGLFNNGVFIDELVGIL